MTDRKLRRRSKRETKIKSRPFSPSSPQITAGVFKGRLVRDLSDEDLKRFLASPAAGQQMRKQINSWTGVESYCDDHSQYWASKYEIEQRKEATRPKPPSLEIQSDDDYKEVASQLIQYGFLEATRRYHSDRHPGKPDIQEVHKLINRANQWLKGLIAKDGK